MIKERFILALAALCLVASIGPACAAGLTLTKTTYTHEEETAPAVVIENDFYSATLVPDMGGRILAWRDKKTGTAMVYDHGYGGLLDDHGARVKMPYEAEWLKKDADEIVVRLSLDEEIKIQKTLTFSALRPTIVVEYHVENHGQAPHRMLFRNVVRPGGTDFTGDELYCYSRVVGLQRANGMPRTDDQADPWCALVHVPTKLAVANAFEGDALARLYTWSGSKVAPTYEFMFPQLEEGHQVDIRYTWAFTHGLAAVDYAHRTFVAQVEGAFDGNTVTAELAVVATWDTMPDLKVSAVVLNAKRKEVARLAHQAMPVNALDMVATLNLTVPVAAGAGSGSAPELSHLPGSGTASRSDMAILLLTLESDVIGPPIVIEKPFAAGDDPKRLATYTRPVRWIGDPVRQEPIAGWVKEVQYTIQPEAADKERGYMVFDEIGEGAGRHTSAIALHVAQNEPEAFPLHVHSITKTGTVSIEVDAPAGMTVESFIPEMMPETLWGRTMNGLKLNPGTSCEIKPGDDRVLYFRAKATALQPGQHVAHLTFNMPGADPSTVDVNVAVYPVRFPRHPFMVFDVNNVVNYLCSRQIKGTDWEWDAERAQNYLSDMELHGVHGQTLNGVNAPNSYFWYNRVKVRETGQVLTEAIKEAPARFRDRLDLPTLDFSEWDWLVDRLLEHGQTHLRWPMGGCGNGFMQGHSKLTTLIYGHTFPSGDARQMAVQEWYYHEVTRYLKDRGLTRIFGIIDDEIPGEKLAWWVQHAYRAIQMGVEPGVTQSAETIASNLKMNLVAPFMKYWIVGTLHKASLDLRREQNLIKPGHRLITYHSSANHWQPYSNTRGYCGLNTAYFDLDACWIQTYYRWNQSEAIIYPGEKGPTSSAAWEGARDGLDDGNMLRLARAMVAAVPDRQERESLTARVESIVGMREDSVVRFADKMIRVGMVTSLTAYDVAAFREAKRQLLDLIVELQDAVPVQRAGANFGLHPLVRDGRAVYLVPDGLPMRKEALDFLSRTATPLVYDGPTAGAFDPENPYPILFVGTLQELRSLSPALADHPDLADLSTGYPAVGGYAVRFVQRKPNLRKKEREADMPESMLVVAGDAAGAIKGLSNLLNVVTRPKNLYSHWLPGQWR